MANAHEAEYSNDDDSDDDVRRENATLFVARLMEKGFLHNGMILQAIADFAHEVAESPPYDIGKAEEAKARGKRFCGPNGELWKAVGADIRDEFENWGWKVR